MPQKGKLPIVYYIASMIVHALFVLSHLILTAIFWGGQYYFKQILKWEEKNLGPTCTKVFFLLVGNIRKLGMGCSAFEPWSATYHVSLGVSIPFIFICEGSQPQQNKLSIISLLWFQLVYLKDLASLSISFWKAKTMGSGLRLVLIS